MTARGAERIWAMVVADEHETADPVLERLRGAGVAAFTVNGARSALGALGAVRPNAVVVCLRRSLDERYGLITALRRDARRTSVRTVVLAEPDESEPLLRAGYDAVASEPDELGGAVRSLAAMRGARAA
jgi:hypothetical protein